MGSHDDAPDETEAQAVADGIRRLRDTIVERWRRQVLDDPRVPEASRLPEPAIRDHVPALLDAIADAVERAVCAPSSPVLAGEPESRLHALDRFVRDYSLESVLREVSHLRGALYDVLVESGCRASHGAARVIGAALDDVMTTAALATQRLAIDDLTRSEAKYRRLVDANVVGVMEIGLTDGRIHDANDALLAMLGYSRADLEAGALGWERITPEEAREADVQVGEDLQREGRSGILERQYLRKDGGRVHVLAGATLVPRLPDVALVIVVDVEPLWRAQQELRREAEIRERFIAVLAHDLRQPLSSLGIGHDTLLRHADLPEPDRAVVRRLRNADERMSRMVSDLLDFARASSGGIPVEPAPGVQLRPVLVRVGEEVAGAHGDVEVKIVGGDVAGRWDEQRLAQLFANVIGNAAEHGDRTAPIVVRIEPETERVRVTVWNRNRGGPIDPAQLPTLFHPFARRGKRRAGLGLGLYIASEIAHAHGGTIEVASDGGGTELRVALPLTATPVDTDHSPPRPDRVG